MTHEIADSPSAVRNLVNIGRRKRADWLQLEQLRLGLRPKLGWNRADEFWFEPEFAKNRTDFAKGHGGRLEFHVNNIVVPIHLVMETRNRPELDVQLEDLVQIAHPGRVNFQ